MRERVLTLLDGTQIRKGDKVRAVGESGGLRVCTVLEVLAGGVDKAILTSSGGKRWFFGTVIRTRYQIKPYKEAGSRAPRQRRNGMSIEDKIKQAVIEAIKSIPELEGCSTDTVTVTIDGLSYHVEFNVPMPVVFGGA